jgi:hypothetical protein
MGGSMHIFSKEHRFMAVTECRDKPVGAGLALPINILKLVV